MGLLLPFVAVTHNLNPAEFVAELIDKAGITRPPYNWCRFDCATWLADAEGARKLEGGFPPAPQSSSLEETISRLARLHTDYLVRQQEEDGSLYLQYEPFQNRLYRGISTPRLAHAAWVMARAHKMLGEPALKDASSKIIDRLLKYVREGEHGCWLEAGDDETTVAEVSFLLLALCQLPGIGRPPSVGREIIGNAVVEHKLARSHQYSSSTGSRPRPVSGLFSGASAFSSWRGARGRCRPIR